MATSMDYLNLGLPQETSGGWYAEAEIQRASLYSLFMVAPAYIFILRGPEQVFELVNPKCAELTGKDVIGQTVRSARSEFIRQYIPIYDRVFRTGEAFYGNEALIIAEDADGLPTERYFNFVIHPLRDRHAQIDGVVYFGFDVTEQVLARKMMERAAMRASRLQATMSALSKALTPKEVADAIVGHGVKILGAYAGVVAIFNEDRSELNSVTVMGYPTYVADRLANISITTQLPIVEAALTGKPSWVRNLEEFQRRYPDWGDPAHRSPTQAIAAFPLQIEDRVIGSYAFAYPSPQTFGQEEQAYMHTLAAQGALAMERARLFRKTAEAVSAREEFLSIASHELKTPLTSLKMQLQINQRMAATFPDMKISDPQFLDRVRSGEKQIDRLTKLINNLLDVSKIRNDKLDIVLEDVDFSEVLTEVQQRFSHEAQLAGCDLILDVPRTLTGVWDKLRLEQLVSNLISNALKFSAKKPVEIILSGDEREAILTVRDHGIGISPENQAKIFDRFERAVSVRDFDGMGLGLYISRSIVQAHGGEIFVKSALGEGASFTVRLPRR